MEIIKPSPFCEGGYAYLTTEFSEIFYKGETVAAPLLGYKCPKTGESFTTAYIDDLNYATINYWFNIIYCPSKNMEYPKDLSDLMDLHPIQK